MHFNAQKYSSDHPEATLINNNKYNQFHSQKTIKQLITAGELSPLDSYQSSDDLQNDIDTITNKHSHLMSKIYQFQPVPITNEDQDNTE